MPRPINLRTKAIRELKANLGRMPSEDLIAARVELLAAKLFRPQNWPHTIVVEINAANDDTVIQALNHLRSKLTGDNRPSEYYIPAEVTTSDGEYPIAYYELRLRKPQLKSAMEGLRVGRTPTIARARDYRRQPSMDLEKLTAAASILDGKGIEGEIVHEWTHSTVMLDGRARHRYIFKFQNVKTGGITVLRILGEIHRMSDGKLSGTATHKDMRACFPKYAPYLPLIGVPIDDPGVIELWKRIDKEANFLAVKSNQA